ncbi:MAG: hypothetical protein OXI13_05280 [Gammaproteobacteria bacterium]|nr:hypothetical protein [Gammaproteobacteria bacterium]
MQDGAGKYNYAVSAAPELPSWKANLRLSWNRGNHAIVSTVHYVDAMPWTPHPSGTPGRPNPDYSFISGIGGFYYPSNILETGVLAWTDMDIAYTYRGLELFDGQMALTIGSRNVFDREAQRSPEFAGVIGGLQDPLGRMLYARMVYDF